MSRYYKQFRHGTGEAARQLRERLARKEMGDAAWEEAASHHDDRAFKRVGIAFIVLFAVVVLGLVWLGY